MRYNIEQQTNLQIENNLLIKSYYGTFDKYLLLYYDLMEYTISIFNNEKIYPYDILIYSDPWDPNYINIEYNSIDIKNIQTRFIYKIYVAGKIYFEEMVDSNYICMFLRSIILFAIQTFRKYFNYKKFDILYNKMITDFMMHCLLHEWYHYQQYI